MKPANGRQAIMSLIRIADYFNVSIDYLLGRSSDPRFYP